MSSYALLQQAADSKQEVVAVDLEGTLTAGSAWRGMRDYLVENGQEAEAKRFVYKRLPEYYVRRITGRGMREFKNRWILQLLQFFRGYSEAQFQEMTAWAVENEIWPQRRLPVLQELAEHLAQGYRVIVVTGLFEPYVASLIAKMPGVEAIGTPMVFEDGLVTGKLATPFNIGTRKVEALTPFMREGKILSAYGDTFPDRHMLAASTLPVAVSPDKNLRRLAQEKGWRILQEEAKSPSNGTGDAA
jgi:HAD superfamily phosphoserine phosphatase-like hydrolase